MISELETIARLSLSLTLGGLIGLEREVLRKPAGLRTHILVALGSTLFTILSLYGFPGSDPARVAAYVVAGIGFIGGGTIIQSRDRVIGITTAASLFVTAAIGMACGVGLYISAVFVTAVAFIALRFGKMSKE